MKFLELATDFVCLHGVQIKVHVLNYANLQYIHHTVDLPNFEHVPYFEHHINKQFSKPTTYKLINLVHKDVFRLVNEIKKLHK